MMRVACALALLVAVPAIKTQPAAEQDDEKIFAQMNAAMEQKLAAAPQPVPAKPAAKGTEQQQVMREQAQQMLGKAAEASDIMGNIKKWKAYYAKLSPAEKAALGKKYWSGLFSFWLVWMVLGLLVGQFMYRPKPVNPDEKTLDDPNDPIYELESQHFGCLEDPNVALISFCCPMVRWAYNMEEAGFMKYWQAYLSFALCIFLNWIFKGSMNYGIITMALCMYMRKKFRERLEMDYSITTAITDAAYALCCNCCLIAQEARVLKAAQFAGHEEFEVKGKQID